MAAKVPIRTRFTLANVLKLARIAVFLFGTYVTIWYFFSFIGVIVGLMYFLLLRDAQWKRHGLVLAWIAGGSTLFLNIIGLLHAQGLATLSTIYLEIVSGPGLMLTYIIWFLAKQELAKRRARISRQERGNAWTWKNLPRFTKTVALCGLCIGPSILWGSLNIDFGVLFDNAPSLLWIHAPTTANTSSNFTVTVEAWDACERESALYAGTVSFSLRSFNFTTFTPLSGAEARLPGPYTFTGQVLPSEWAYEIQDGRDNGAHAFTVRIDTPGIHYLLVHDSATGNTYWSNPIIVNGTSAPASQIYWGDMHSHSQLSDGSGTPQHHYYYARYVACLDFCALTDHGELMQVEPGACDALEQATNDAYVPGEFVALQGMEWTQVQDGHKTCIFSGNQLPKNPPLSFMSQSTPGDLWNALDNLTANTGCQALAIPHHTTKAEYIEDWTYTNPRYEKFAEVTSVHGECLFEQRDPSCLRPLGDAPGNYTPGTCVMDAFKMGYRLACAANSDEHDGHPGHSLGHTAAYIGCQQPLSTWSPRVDLPYPGGITAVHAANLTRGAIFIGLENALIYASSDNGRPYLDFTINGTRVKYNSTLVVASPTTTRAITITIAQDGVPAPGMRPKAAAVVPGWVPDWNATVQVFKNGVLLAAIPIDTPVAKVTYLDAAPVTGTAYGTDNCVNINGKYYINSFSDKPINPGTLNTGGEDFYVARIVGHNGRTAYAGPIWVEFS